MGRIILRALLDEDEVVFINCGHTLDWFVRADSKSQICVVTIDDDTGDQHQKLVEKRRISDITIQEG